MNSVCLFFFFFFSYTFFLFLPFPARRNCKYWWWEAEVRGENATASALRNVGPLLLLVFICIPSKPIKLPLDFVPLLLWVPMGRCGAGSLGLASALSPMATFAPVLTKESPTPHPHRAYDGRCGGEG